MAEFQVDPSSERKTAKLMYLPESTSFGSYIFMSWKSCGATNEYLIDFIEEERERV